MTCSKNNEVLLEGFSFQISEASLKKHKPDILLDCLSDIDIFIEKIDSTDNIEDLKNNLVHVDDDFYFNGTITLTNLFFNEASIDSVKVCIKISVSHFPIRHYRLMIRLLQVLSNFNDAITKTPSDWWCLCFW